MTTGLESPCAVVPITSEMRALALQEALRAMNRSHVGWVHEAYQPVEYQPEKCPGCAYAVIREMFRDEGVRGV